MAPAGNIDARYSTSNKSQRDMYVVNINLNIQGRPGKSNLHGDFHVLMGQVIGFNSDKDNNVIAELFFLNSELIHEGMVQFTYSVGCSK